VNGVGLQRVKQEDNLIGYINYRHVSTIRYIYLLHCLWCMLCIVAMRRRDRQFANLYIYIYFILHINSV
jgi:uncharacterized membrane protein YhaH (DUF805 family)